MPKKKSSPLYRQWWFPYVSAGVILPTIALMYGYISDAIAGGQEIKSVKQAVVQQANISQDLKEIVMEQRTKNELQDAEIAKGKEVSQLQIDSLKALLAVMKR